LAGSAALSPGAWIVLAAPEGKRLRWPAGARNRQSQNQEIKLQFGVGFEPRSLAEAPAMLGCVGSTSSYDPPSYDPPPRLLRREQRVDESVDHDRDRDHDEDAHHITARTPRLNLRRG
jgi:hypothetical protein